MVQNDIWGIHRRIIGSIPCFFFAQGQMTLTGQMLIEAHTDATDIIARRCYPKNTKITKALIDKEVKAMIQFLSIQCQALYIHIYFDDTIIISIYCKYIVQGIPT
jgi:hypothetical protein